MGLHFIFIGAGFQGLHFRKISFGIWTNLGVFDCIALLITECIVHEGVHEYLWLVGFWHLNILL